MENNKGNNTILSLLSIVFAAATISLCAFIDGCEQEKTPATIDQPLVLVQTNQMERAGQQQGFDWFKDNSSYIWDGWKIK